MGAVKPSQAAAGRPQQPGFQDLNSGVSQMLAAGSAMEQSFNPLREKAVAALQDLTQLAAGREPAHEARRQQLLADTNKGIDRLLEQGKALERSLQPHKEKACAAVGTAAADAGKFAFSTEPEQEARRQAALRELNAGIDRTLAAGRTMEQSLNPHKERACAAVGDAVRQTVAMEREMQPHRAKTLSFFEKLNPLTSCRDARHS